MMLRESGRSKRLYTQGFTLIEVLISLVIAVAMVTGIITLFSFNFAYQNQQELRASAADHLAHEMEKVKQKFIFTVPPYYALTITDNRTPDNPNDDTEGVLRVQLFARNKSNGTEFALTGDPNEQYLVASDDRVRVVMTMTWHGRGRYSNREYRESLVGYLIP